jgi:deoxynucleoside triphosphate triphosphohydrolase SAMHD1
MKCSYDFRRLMRHSRVINDEICFHSKNAFDIYEMFHTRYRLWKQVYAHHVGKAIEYMISDAYTLADPYMHISKCIDSPVKYMRMTGR